ncbi:unnamed protein product, partial [Ilex paraguariensis]
AEGVNIQSIQIRIIDLMEKMKDPQTGSELFTKNSKNYLVHMEDEERQVVFNQCDPNPLAVLYRAKNLWGGNIVSYKGLGKRHKAPSQIRRRWNPPESPDLKINCYGSFNKKTNKAPVGVVQ